MVTLKPTSMTVALGGPIFMKRVISRMKWRILVINRLPPLYTPQSFTLGDFGPRTLQEISRHVDHQAGGEFIFSSSVSLS